LVLVRILLAAGAKEAEIEQAGGARQHAGLTQVAAAEVPPDATAHARQRRGEVEHRVELLLVAAFPPGIVVAVLLAPGGVDPGGLEMPVRVWADPHLVPGRGDREVADPLEHSLIGDAPAALIAIFEAPSPPPPRDPRARAVHTAQSRHSASAVPRRGRANTGTRPPRVRPEA